MPGTELIEQVERALASGNAMDVAELAQSTRLAEDAVRDALTDMERDGRVIPAQGGRWSLPPTELEDKQETDEQPGSPA